MSKIIVITSDRHLVSKVQNVASQKNCPVEHYTDQEWKNKQTQSKKSSSNVVSINRKKSSYQTGPVIKNLKPLEEVQKDTIYQALYSMSGNVSRVSKALSIGRATLYRKIKDHDIDLSDIRDPKKKPAKMAS